jgi:hypothetical protein
VNSLTPVVATLSGVVVERKLAQGQVVQPADALFVVADLSNLWAVAQVPEQQVSQVKAGQSVSIEVPALGNEKLLGKLIYVGQTIDPETRTVLVRTELDNSDGRFKPAMLASMLIEAKPVSGWSFRPVRWCARTTRIMSLSRKRRALPSGQGQAGGGAGRAACGALRTQGAENGWLLTALFT